MFRAWHDESTFVDVHHRIHFFICPFAIHTFRPLVMSGPSRSAVVCFRSRQLASRTSGSDLRYYSAKPDRHITILGEGLTGLYTAYRLSSSPGIKITLLDSASRVGGWVDSRNRPVKFVDEQGELVQGEVTLESSIRPRGSRGAAGMLKLVSRSLMR